MTIDPRTVPSHRFHAQQPKAPEERKSEDLQKLRESCREFEAILVMEMYKAMRKSVPDGGLFEKSMATELYQDMFDQQIAEKTSQGPGMGIGEAMYRQMAGLIENKKYE
ncbi:MAG: rod-binding protein [Desulfopila sp.]